MKILLVLALVGCAAALQAQVEYTYLYKARVCTGIQAHRPQCAGTGIRATVTVTVQTEGEATFQMSNIKVGEKNQVLGNNGRDELAIDYEDIKDKALELPFKAYFRTNNNNQIAMEVPASDLLWVTNVRRGVAHMFKIAPIIEPNIVSLQLNNSGIPQQFSWTEETYAGRCRVSYTISPATLYYPQPLLREDIQAQDAPKAPGGKQVKLCMNLFRLQSSIDFSSCSDRPALMHTGAGNLTNVTSSTFQGVASRAYNTQYILRGEPGKIRIESAEVESIFSMNPFGVDTDKMAIISNQTLSLQSTRPTSRYAGRIQGELKQIQTWRHQFQSPNARPEGYAPRWIQYKKENESPYSPIFFERMTSGFGWTQQSQDLSKQRIASSIKSASEKLFAQNKESSSKPDGYRGSEDGRAVQELYTAHKLIRSLPYDKLKQLYDEFEQQEHQCRECKNLYIDALAVAASGPSVSLLLEKIQSQEISENGTASIFFNLANNIQSPEVIEKLMNFVIAIKDEEHVMLSLFAKINFSHLARRLCVSPHIRHYSHMAYIYGDKMCKRDMIVKTYLPHIHELIRTSTKPWVKIVNIVAAGNVGAEETLQLLEEVARGVYGDYDKFVRIAAIHSMGASKFDNTSRNHIFNILQPIAENQREDYRIRQIAYYNLLTWKPNATLIHRMALSSSREPSRQMQSFTYWVISSLAKINEPEFREMSHAARNLIPFTKFMDPSLHLSMSSLTSKCLYDEQIGSTTYVGWLTSYKDQFPEEIFNYVSGKYGHFKIPLIETITFGNSRGANAILTDMIKTLFSPKSSSHAGRSSLERRQQERKERVTEEIRANRLAPGPSTDDGIPDIYYYLKLWGSSEVILPMTNELYSDLESRAVEIFRKLKDDQQVVYHKYMNPVEVTVILPSPLGLFTQTEVSTPTILFGDISGYLMPDPPIEDPAHLPRLERISMKFNGTVKIVSKCNTYSTVFAPWTNRTVMSAVDNEKSLSIPMKYEMVGNLKMPYQIVWGQIIPDFHEESERIPIFKVRNVPFTAIGKLFPSPVATGEIIDFKRVSWLYDESEETAIVVPISKELTGLNAEFEFRGQVSPPFRQPNIIAYLSEPSRILSLLASPTIKPYDLTLYHKGLASTKNIGFHYRHMITHGDGEEIIVPNSAHRPVDVSAEDNLIQRVGKLAKFSNKQIHESSFLLNFTGSADKIYEASFIWTTDERTPVGDMSENLYRKWQVSFLEKNAESSRKPKTCSVVTSKHPGPPAPNDLAETFTRIGGNIYEGENCAGDDILVEAKADLRISSKQIGQLQRLFDLDNPDHDITKSMYEEAVYDQLHLNATWNQPSPSFKNVTLRLRDLTEGYLFPKIIKNYMVDNPSNKMEITANRSITDDRAEAWVVMPQATAHVQHVDVHPWVDWFLAITDDIISIGSPYPRRRMINSAAAPGDMCRILSERVRTFDGVTFEKKLTTCFQVVTKVEQGEDDILVQTRQMSALPSSDQEVKILSAKQGIDVTLSGSTIKRDGEAMREQSGVIKDHSGIVSAKVMKVSGMIKLTIPGKLEVVLKDRNQLQVKLDTRYKNVAKGLCGDFDTESMEDLSSPKQCVFAVTEGPVFAASWVSHKSECQDQQMRPLFEKLRQQEQNCQKLRRLNAYPHYCQENVYKIISEGSDLCISKESVKMCNNGCAAKSTSSQNIEMSCWSRSSAPEEVRSKLNQGYTTTPVHAQAQKTERHSVSVPTTCVSSSRLGASNLLGPAGDLSCYENAYSVASEGALICVTTGTMQVCKAECNVGDTDPLELPSKCWNRDQAPQAVQDAVHVGHISNPVLELAEFTTDMVFDLSLYCFNSTY